MLFFIPEYSSSQNFRVERYKIYAIRAVLNSTGTACPETLEKLQIGILP